MNPYYVGILVPVVLSLLVRSNKPRKRRGVPVDVGGEPGHALRNHSSPSLVESAWDEISTLTELIEWSCKLHRNKPFLGTGKLISNETELTQDGRGLEKVHLGEYEWVTYEKVFQDICDFSCGLVQLNHSRNERVAIFADTREEWFIALQGCFRRNVTVVTIYASLGEEALCHSLNETEVTTVVCGQKEMKKLVDICEQLDSVKRVICMDDELSPNFSSVEGKWKVYSFATVKRLGRENFVDADMPLSADTAVIMYTSGSTGLPKVKRC